MAIMRNKEITRLNRKELQEKLKELEFEKLKTAAHKGQASGSSNKTREIKRTISRINAQLNQTKE